MDRSCLAAGAAATLGAFLRDYLMKPLGIILLIVLVTTTLVAIPGIPITIIAYRMNGDLNYAISIGLGGGVLADALIAMIAVPISAGLHDKWQKTGRKYALACQQRKKARRDSTERDHPTAR